MEQRRIAAIPFLKRGISLSSVARQLGVSRQAVFVWHQQFSRHGWAGLRRRQRPGRPPKLTSGQGSQISRWLNNSAEDYGRPTWTANEVAEMVSVRMGLPCRRAHICRLLKSIGFAWSGHVGLFRAGWVPAEFRWLAHLLSDCLIRERGPKLSLSEESGTRALKRAGRRLGYEVKGALSQKALYWLVGGRRRFAWLALGRYRNLFHEKGGRELKKAKVSFRLVLLLDGNNFSIAPFHNWRRQFSMLRAELASRFHRRQP